jgi:tetratricopeptide (TPR) repeat protein
MTIKGCTMEVEAAYKKALELCRKYGKIPQSFTILRSLASFYVYIVDLKNSAHFGKQILNLAEELDDDTMRVEGHLVFGYSIAFSGNVKEGLKHLEKGITMYNPEIPGSYSMRFGNNPGVISHTTSALCLWMCGFPDRAIQLTDDAIALADKINHPSSIAYALFHTGLLRLWRHEVEIVLEHAQTVLEIARKYDFQIWEAVASCLHGAALSGMAKVDDGILEVKRGIEMYAESNNPPIFWPMLLLLHAGSYIQAERPREGLDIINKALEIIGTDSGHPIISDITRLKGDVILLISPENFEEAESYFKRAIDIARKHETKMYELKASMSLSELWHNKGDTSKGKQLLTSIYEKFTEGYKTADLIKARDILQKLS